MDRSWPLEHGVDCIGDAVGLAFSSLPTGREETGHRLDLSTASCELEEQIAFKHESVPDIAEGRVHDLLDGGDRCGRHRRNAPGSAVNLVVEHIDCENCI